MKPRKRKTISGRRAASVTAALLLVLFCGLAGLLLFGLSYTEIYRSPAPAREGHMDFAGYPLDGRTVECLLSGEWEFFYGRWIVTDGDDAPADGYISVPGRWTGKTVNGKTLGRAGYASYRLTVDNVKAGESIFVYRKNYGTSFRIFVNGQISTANGTPSREDIGTPDGQVEIADRYVTDGGPVTVVIELSWSERGGLTAAPWLSGRTGGTSFGNSLKAFCFTMLGFTAAVFLTGVMIAAGFYRYHHDLSMPFVLLALLLILIFSQDLVTHLSLPFVFSMWMGGISRILLLFALLWHLEKAGMRMGKAGLPLWIGALAAGVLLCYLVRGTYFIAAAVFLFPALILLLCYPLLRAPMRGRFKWVYCGLLFVIACIFAAELAGGTGLVPFGIETFLSVLTAVLAALFAAVGFIRVNDAARDMLRASELEQELTRVKQQALKAQIKPHFVFNSLTAIQALYHRDLSDGDEALERFARHLRLNVDADGAEVVPFEQEVKNILNYFELENLRLGGKLTLLLDVNATDFTVPVLSLQPLVENAIRHGGTADLENGYISLSANEDVDGVTVVISDNGVGFDPAAVPEGTGLTNARERLKGLIGAELSVESAPGRGTTIRIKIPRKGEPE